MNMPTRFTDPSDPKLIAAFDRAQIDPRTFEQIVRLERARMIGESPATAIVWLIRLPRRIVDALRARHDRPAGGRPAAVR